MKKYLNRVETTDGFTILSSLEAELLRNSCGNIGQNGIRYPFDNAVVLQSNTAEDLLDALEKGYWDHTKCPTQVGPKDTVYVIANAKESNRLGTKFGIKGTIESITKVSNIDTSWTSYVNNDPNVLLDKAIVAEKINVH